MEIATNTQTTNTYTQTKQKENSSSDISFGQYMDTKEQQDTKTKNTTPLQEDYIEINNTTEQTQTLTYTKEVAQTEPYDPNKKYLNTLDKCMPNYFEDNDISKEDEKIIRSVLADNTISESEVRNLSFEQAKYLQELKFDLMNYGTENNIPVMFMSGENPKVQHILGATDFTKNDTFNKAIHKTFVENSSLDENEMMTILGQLSNTLIDAYSGMGVKLDSTSTLGLLSNFKNPEFDYKKCLLELLNILDTLLNKPLTPELREEYTLLNTNFEKILENYQDIEDKEIRRE
jgi:hypothetical protein